MSEASRPVANAEGYIGRAICQQEARAKLKSGPMPDIALINLGLPDGNGVDLIEFIQRRAPATLCVVASIYHDDGHIFPALRAGARGYLLKDRPVTAITAGRPALTERETEVLRLISKGMTRAETARLLAISQHTVAGYVKELYRKLNVNSRAEAALLARDMGLD